MTAREDFGHAGHFCGSSRCRFTRHTHVNGYCVSTVGDWWPMSATDGPEEIGVGRMFETMVFKLVVDKYGQVDIVDPELRMVPYNDAAAADAGHEAMVIEMEKRQ